MSNLFSILIIEDEKNICSFMSKILIGQGYRVSSCENGQSALASITSNCPDIILLDLGLPDMDGLEIIRQVRTWTDCPILVISARTQEKEKVEALDLGADDYITKPFGTEELLARIRTSLRHSHKSASKNKKGRPGCRYEAGGLSIDFENHSVELNQAALHLTPVEYRIVTYLAQNSGKVLTYHSIMKHVWGPYVDDDNKILRVNMANIRRKLEKNPGEPRFIFTELGVGYRMLEDGAE